jgi:superfamily II DNA or RNA helicase
MEERRMRAHQRQMNQFASQIIAGIYTKQSITLDCTPGGGKTGAATLLANRLLDACFIDRVLWLVPRISLAEQVVDAFAKGFGASSSRELEVVDGQDNLFAPSLPNMPLKVGVVTTYQSIAHKKNWERFRDALAARRTLLILDEVQFLNDDQTVNRGWQPKARAIHDVASFRLLMSGTLWRTDDKRIPFIEYQKRDDGRLYPLCDINYDLRKAVAERAVLPIEWRNRNGLVEYTRNGVAQTHDLLDDGDDEETYKLRTFLSSDKVVHAILDEMVEDWRSWCRSAYQSRMLVMAEDIGQARRWRTYLQDKHNIACTLATSKEEAAGRQLRHFRERKQGQCLITVAMAYVGFDCPDLTHLAYLSHYRAPSWMLQSFARVSRFDPLAPVAYDSQHAFVYAPDDERMRRFCHWVREQTDMGIADSRRGGGGGGGGKGPDDFEPGDAAIGSQVVESLQERLGPEATARLDAFARSSPAAVDVPRSKLAQLLRDAGVDLTRLAPRKGTSDARNAG